MSRNQRFTTEEVLKEVMMDADSGGESDFEIDSDSEVEDGDAAVVDRGRVSNIGKLTVQ